MSDRIDVPLPDGRSLEVAVSGPERGLVLLDHHGTPGTAYQSAHLQREAHARGLRLVSSTRPGGGSSTRRPGRSVVDVAADMEAVLDHLGADRCITIGGSGGGPHTLATGALMPERVAGVVCLCGVRPYGEGFLDGMGQDNLDEFGLALEGENALRPYLEQQRVALKDAQAADVVAQLETLLPPPDVAVLSGELGEDIAAGLREAVVTLDGWIDDDLAFTRDWGFDPASLTVPTFLWQGTADLMVPAHHATALAELIPQATLHVEEGEGHLSISVGFLGRALDEALAHA